MNKYITLPECIYTWKYQHMMLQDFRTVSSRAEQYGYNDTVACLCMDLYHAVRDFRTGTKPRVAVKINEGSESFLAEDIRHFLITNNYSNEVEEVLSWVRDELNPPIRVDMIPSKLEEV